MLKRGIYTYHHKVPWLEHGAGTGNGSQTREDLRFAFADRRMQPEQEEVRSPSYGRRRSEEKRNRSAAGTSYCQRRGREEKPKRAAAAPPVVRWKGVKPNASARSLSDDKDAAERKSIAKQLAATAKAWRKAPCWRFTQRRAGADHVASHERQSRAVEASSAKIRLRTWISWIRWTKNRAMQLLGAPAAAIQESCRTMHEQAQQLQRVHREQDGITTSRW